MRALRCAVSRGVVFRTPSVHLPNRITPNCSYRNSCTQTLLAATRPYRTCLTSRRLSYEQSLGSKEESPTSAELKEDCNGCPDRPPKNSYPFLGHEIKKINNIHDGAHVTDHVSYPLSIKCGKRDGNGVERVDEEFSSDRFYRFTQPNEDEHLLPSVTTVLQSTRPARERFRLYNWRRSMIKKHGEWQFHKLKMDTMHNGSQFHKVSNCGITERAF